MPPTSMVWVSLILGLLRAGWRERVMLIRAIARIRAHDSLAVKGGACAASSTDSSTPTLTLNHAAC